MIALCALVFFAVANSPAADPVERRMLGKLVTNQFRVNKNRLPKKKKEEIKTAAAAETPAGQRYRQILRRHNMKPKTTKTKMMKPIPSEQMKKLQQQLELREQQKLQQLRLRELCTSAVPSTTNLANVATSGITVTVGTPVNLDCAPGFGFGSAAQPVATCAAAGQQYTIANAENCVSVERELCTSAVPSTTNLANVATSGITVTVGTPVNLDCAPGFGFGSAAQPVATCAAAGQQYTIANAENCVSVEQLMQKQTSAPPRRFLRGNSAN